MGVWGIDTDLALVSGVGRLTSAATVVGRATGPASRRPGQQTARQAGRLPAGHAGDQAEHEETGHEQRDRERDRQEARGLRLAIVVFLGVVIVIVIVIVIVVVLMCMHVRR